MKLSARTIASTAIPAGLFIAASALWPSGSARAHHSLEVVHSPATAVALEGADVQIEVNVKSGCVPVGGYTATCEDIVVSVNWTETVTVESSPDKKGKTTTSTQEVTRSVTETVPHAPAQAVVLTVPASAVKNGSFSYWVGAVQAYCENTGCGFYCHDATARSPSGGSHTISTFSAL